jgi:hypothetical protein
MGLLDDVLQHEAAFWLDSDLFAEQVQFKPRAGGSRTIYAIVDRLPPQRLDADGNVYVASVEIVVKNNSLDGIALSEINNGGDRVTVQVRKGKTASNLLIMGEPLEQDSGLIRLALK